MTDKVNMTHISRDRTRCLSAPADLHIEKILSLFACDAIVVFTIITMATVQSVIELKEKLSSEEGATDQKAYRDLIVVAGDADSTVKQLAAQFIPMFFHNFPAEADKALNAQIDLCEDESSAIRSYAIRGLAVMCKEKAEHIPRVAPIFGQLLVLDGAELVLVREQFAKLFEKDLEACFTALLAQMGSEDLALAKNFRIQVQKNRKAVDESEELGAALVEGLLAIMGDASVELFNQLMGLLNRLKAFKSDEKAAEKVTEVLKARANLETAYNPSDAEATARLVDAMRSANRACKAGQPSEVCVCVCVCVSERERV
jgi:hypothetical protein